MLFCLYSDRYLKVILFTTMPRDIFGKCYQTNRIGGVMISVLALRADWVKPNTAKLVFVASPTKMQHQGARTKTGWFGTRIKFLPSDCCFSELITIQI